MRSPWKFLSPSISHILFVVIFLQLSFNVGNRMLDDGDTGYHIRAGEIILETLSVPMQDAFSFRSPPLEWTAHEWLSEVVMALVHQLSGLTGVVLFFVFLISLTYAWLFRFVRSYGQNILADLSIVLFVIICSQLHWLARPHVFSLPLMILWYSILDRFDHGGKNRLFLLPLMTLPWVNLHGGFIVGFVLIGVYFLANLCRYLSSEQETRPDFRRKTAYLGITLLACLLASLANPQGYRILLFPFQLTFDSYLMDHVDEFLSPDFHENAFFRYFLVYTFGILILSRTRMKIVDGLLVLLFFSMALYSKRYIPLFGIFAAPVLSKHAGELAGRRPGWRIPDAIRRSSGRIAAIDEGSRGSLWPVAAVEFLQREHLQGNMFNNDEFGDYVIYSAYPQYKVFIDGRGDMYGSENFKEYFEVVSFAPSMEAILRKYDINWIFFNSDSVLSRYLVQHRDWRLIYSDSVASIFVRDIPKNRDVVERMGNVKPYVKDPGGK